MGEEMIGGLAPPPSLGPAPAFNGPVCYTVLVYGITMHCLPSIVHKNRWYHR
jgi:hypothetical protein